MDAFDDLSSPPSALLSVIQNGWISAGIKQSVREGREREEGGRERGEGERERGYYNVASLIHVFLDYTDAQYCCVVDIKGQEKCIKGTVMVLSMYILVFLFCHPIA